MSIYDGASFADAVLSALRRYKNKPAFVLHGRPTTYAETERAIGQCITVLREAGLGRGDGIVLLSTNTAEAFHVRAAASFIGVRFTALHPMGASADHAYIIKDCEAKALFYEAKAFSDDVKKLAEDSAALLLYRFNGDGPGKEVFCDSVSPAPLEIETEANDLAWVCYTGGTTGHPKGVMLSHRAIMSSTLTSLSEWDWPRDINFLAVTPVSHAAGMMVLPTLMKGGAFHMMSSFNIEGFLDYVSEHKITATFLVPTIIYRILDSVKGGDSRLKTLETVIYGAASMSAERLAMAHEILGSVFVQLYGQTEAPNVISALRKSDHNIATPKRLESCGQPTPAAKLAILSQDGSRLKSGEIGEICVRGPFIMDGYWKQKELTDETMAGDWLHTGDAGYIDRDGFLYIVDRMKDMIISGGFNIYSREVEDALLSHPEVSRCAAVGLPDSEWGEIVCAVVEKIEGANLAASDLVAHVRSVKGPLYCPKRVIFVDEVPLTPLAKPDKKAVRRLIEDHKLEETR